MSTPDTPSVSRFDADLAWSLTRTISPRARVRVAAQDAHGALLNLYPGAGATIDGPVPTRPWAMYLADSNHVYRFACFDLDVKSHSLEAVDADTRTIRALLADAAIPHLVCQSGPAGGRHIWFALRDGVAAPVMKTLANELARICPTLDKAPLSNAATGCVRPPGTPHRDGGFSVPILGSLDALTEQAATDVQLTEFLTAVSERVDDVADGPIDPHRPLPVDKHGRMYMPGSRRPLPQPSALALREDAASGDASGVLWRIMLGAAAARWRFDDLLRLQDQPGLEHARTMRVGSRRLARPKAGDQSPMRVLARQWDKAVRFIAATPRTTGADPTFVPRAERLTTLVEALQQRADAAPGRWSSGGGPSDRRVLDQLCLLALQAVSECIEADIRRLALHCGIGRESVRTALIRLADDGWISRAAAAEGVRAARWSIDSQGVLHRESQQGRSQADPRPEGAGADARRQLIHLLSTRATSRTHDVFTSDVGLGIQAGNLYARARERPIEESSSSQQRLLEHGLFRWTRSGWAPTPLPHRDAVARAIGASGRLEARGRTYWIERDTWSRWLDELEWMTTPTKEKWKRRPPGHQQPIYTDGTTRHGKYPRDADGRGDHRQARRLSEAALSGRSVLAERAVVQFRDEQAA